MDFLPLLQKYQDRFANSLNEITSDQIQLFKAYQADPAMQEAFERLNDLSFEKNWDIVKGQFPSLRAFSGALFTVFPNTSTVESDFSIIGWEKNAHRKCLSNLSLEGVLQARPFEDLQNFI